MWDGDNKKKARSIALDFKASEHHAALFLPGPECKCVREALLLTMNQRKPLYLFERNKSNWSQIYQNIRGMGCTKYSLYENVAELTSLGKVDFAYLDFMGSMDESLYNWSKNHLIPSLAPPCRISMLFTLSWRPRQPFLEEKLAEYRANGKLFDVSFQNNCRGRLQIATYLNVVKELFQVLPYNFIESNGYPYYYYNDNVNPVVLYTVQIDHAQKESRMSAVLAKPSNNLDMLLSGFAVASKNYDKMRGWKRSLTLYCRNKEEETGTAATRFKAAVKMRLTKMGHDASSI